MEAALGFKIDSSQAPAAAVDLEKLYASAVKIEGAVDRLEASSKGLNAALSQTGQSAQRTVQPVESVNRALSQQDEHVRSFRMEMERLTAKYQPLAQATREYETSVGEINRAHQLGIINAQQMQKALDAERMAYDRLKQSAQSAGQAVQAANQNQGPSGAQRAAGINAGYQFQDIAVTAAMGMNPLMIGLQQGTQLSSVVASMERPVAGLAAAFTSLISPVSLITIGLTAGAAALIQYFTTASEGSDEFEQKFAKQAELISTVAARWGDAYPALKAYSDQLQATADQAELQAGQNAAVELRYKQMGDALAGLVEIAPQVSRSLRDITTPEGTQAAIAYEQAVADMRKALEVGKDPTEAFGRATQALATIIEQSGNEALRKYGDQFDILSGKMEEATRQAGAFRMQLPDLGALQGPWSENGQIFFPEQFTPANPGVPTRRPRIELGEGWNPSNEVPTIINSDGHLTNVPIPGQRPITLGDPLPSFSGFRANRNTYWSRDVLDEETRRKELGGLFKGFITDFGDALRNNSGDLGKALMEGLSSAVANAASQAWEKFANLGANMLVNAILGQPSAGLLNKGIGFSGANTTLGQILGAGGGMSANDNVSGGFSGLSSSGGMAAFRSAISSIESGGNYGALGPITRNGDRAYGKYQMMGNNIGPWSQAALGRSLSAEEFLANPSLQDQIFDHRFGGYVNKYGASGAAQAWFGGPGSVGKGGGASDILGTTGTAYVEKFNAALGDASKSVGSFGSGLGQIGQAMSTNFFPSAPSAPSGGGGGGGLFGWLGGLFSPNLSKYAGLTGLFADGTNYAPGGLAIVGERGPELVNLPQGSQVFDTNRSARMMGGGREGGGNQRPVQNFYLDGARGDDHIRELARQGAAEGIAQYNERQINGGFGDNQKQYQSRVA